MSQNKESQPGLTNETSQTTESEATRSELTNEDLEQVNGGLIGLLVPAVQKIREAAVSPTPVISNSSVINIKL